MVSVHLNDGLFLIERYVQQEMGKALQFMEVFQLVDRNAILVALVLASIPGPE